MAEKAYHVWECKIVIKGDASLPRGFDQVPRLGAVAAVMDAGFNVLSAFSGWNGTLTDTQKQIVEDSTGSQLGKIKGE